MLPKSNVILFISIVVSTICFVQCKSFVNSHVNNLIIEEISATPEQDLLRKSEFINNTIYEDGVAHVEINELNSKLYEILRFEDAYKNIIAMNGTKYIYKRDFYWRTWRVAVDSTGNISLVCYRCQNIVYITCLKCDCGYWEIEENPPCTFEIFSVVNSTTICIAKYNQLKISNASCPSVISFTDLGICDNPIKSRWRVSRRYGSTSDVSGRHINVICEGRENCEISTVYTILSDRVIFRVFNASDNIIYSRIMKSNNRNYACLYNCSVLGASTQITEQIPEESLNKHLKNNLNRYPDVKSELHNNKPQAKLAPSFTKIRELFKIQINTSILHLLKHPTPTTTAKLRCNHLQHHSEEEDEYSEFDEY